MELLYIRQIDPVLFFWNRISDDLKGRSQVIQNNMVIWNFCVIDRKDCPYSVHVTLEGQGKSLQAS